MGGEKRDGAGDRWRFPCYHIARQVLPSFTLFSRLFAHPGPHGVTMRTRPPPINAVRLALAARSRARPPPRPGLPDSAPAGTATIPSRDRRPWDILRHGSVVRLLLPSPSVRKGGREEGNKAQIKTWSRKIKRRGCDGGSGAANGYRSSVRLPAPTEDRSEASARADSSRPCPPPSARTLATVSKKAPPPSSTFPQHRRSLGSPFFAPSLPPPLSSTRTHTVSPEQSAPQLFPSARRAAPFSALTTVNPRPSGPKDAPNGDEGRKDKGKRADDGSADDRRV